MKAVDVRSINSRRWEEHMKGVLEKGQAPVPEFTLNSVVPSAPTAGALFNRANPVCPNGKAVPPFVRSEKDADGDYGTLGRKRQDERVFPNLEKDGSDVKLWGLPNDFTSLERGHRRKRRIPNTSVVNKVGDCRILCCVGWRLTGAQWIWWLNLLCFIAHTFMFFLTFYLGYWRHELSMWESDHLDVRVYRISQIPTQEMIDNNETTWRNAWNASEPRSFNSDFYLIDNGMPVRPDVPTHHTPYH